VLELAPDPTLSEEIAAVLRELADLKERWEGSVPFALVMAGETFVVIVESYLADNKVLVHPREVMAMEVMLGAAREFHLDDRGWDPFAEVRARQFDVLARIRTQVFRTHFAASDATRVDLLQWSDGATRVTVPLVPGETAHDRRKRVIAYNLRRFREARGFSQEELGKMVGVRDRTHVVKWEAAKYGISDDYLEKLADALGVKPHDFYRDEAAA
jgi:DNA-binding XRE family transcriptional regulator